MSEEGMVGWR